jgi:hypothetical protein
MEGNLPCLKYLLSNATNANSLIAARNDQVSSKLENLDSEVDKNISLL